MSPFKTLDVAIGIAFLYLLLTFVASALVEAISNFKNWRAQMLHDAIANMFKQSQLVTVEDIYNNPLVVALCRDSAAPSWVDIGNRFGWRPDRGGTPPSYIPAAVFSAAVLEALRMKVGEAADLSPEGGIKIIRDALTSPHSIAATGSDTADKGSTSSAAQTGAPVPAKDANEDALKSILTTALVTQGASIQAVRLAIEKWFNDTMDRASGWYKRRTQTCLLLIGLAIALGGNVDTIGVALWLWQGDAARQAVVAAAADYMHNNPRPSGARTSANQGTAYGSAIQGATAASVNQVAPPAGALNGATSNSANQAAIYDSTKQLTDLAAQIVKLDRTITALQYPIGWPPVNPGSLWLLQFLAGALLTAIAISMGSSFWFDALQNLIKIRGTGPKPGPR